MEHRYQVHVTDTEDHNNDVETYLDTFIGYGKRKTEGGKDEKASGMFFLYGTNDTSDFYRALIEFVLNAMAYSQYGGNTAPEDVDRAAFNTLVFLNRIAQADFLKGTKIVIDGHMQKRLFKFGDISQIVDIQPPSDDSKQKE